MSLRPLRILVAQNVSRSRTGGMSRIMGFIHDRVAAAGHRVGYFCAEDVPPSLRGRVARFTFPALLCRHVAAAARSGEPYDIVNVHEPASGLVSLFRRSIGRPLLVVTSHGLEQRAWDLALAELRLGRGGPSWRTRIAYPTTGLWQANTGLRRADHVFCLNFEDRDYLVRHMGIRPERITRIFPGADVGFAGPNEERNYARCHRMLFAATWRKNKGIEDLVPAFIRLAWRWPELRLTILGAGVPEGVVLGAFPEALRTRIDCRLATDDRQTVAAFRAADLFILPSLFEGTPLTLMEAMMSGLPIVTTAVCGMRDVIRDGENGLLVPIRAPEVLADAAGRLLEDADLRARLGRSAHREALDRYTWDRVAESVIQAYERLATQSDRRLPLPGGDMLGGNEVQLCVS
jgi:glycosyltransferase involved in cell wall biosynthesis